MECKGGFWICGDIPTEKHKMGHSVNNFVRKRRYVGVIFMHINVKATLSVKADFKPQNVKTR